MTTPDAVLVATMREAVNTVTSPMADNVRALCDTVERLTRERDEAVQKLMDRHHDYYDCAKILLSDTERGPMAPMILALRAELAGLREDGKRLDWLEHQGIVELAKNQAGQREWFGVYTVGNESDGRGFTLREAIDNARAARTGDR